ncbi:MAG: hypothetical protein LJI21_02615 [Wolbachia endosymbiont of Menacanthus eurysternus]|nr:MAG: hypothetical protein LJI21_02615 [Wolbachia endosymbiont of Menacanthus eurysternus]
MFGIGFSEVLVVALVGIIAFDKRKMPTLIKLIGDVYRYFIVVKSRTKKLLEDSGIESLYKECNNVEKVNYIIGNDGKFYPSYDMSNSENMLYNKSGGNSKGSRNR